MTGWARLGRRASPWVRLLCASLLATGCVAGAVEAEEADAGAALPPDLELDAEKLIRRIEDVMRGDTAQMKAAMTITRPRWSRTVRFRSWDDRKSDRSLIRILDPAKDRGTGFLKVEQTLWTYLPRVERTTRMPPSMLLQPWMGSDFTNDDLVRESSLIDDYTASLIGEREIAGTAAVGVLLVPKEQAPVVWSRLEVWIDRERLSPLLQIYYDEPDPGRYEEVRRMEFSDVREIQGRPVPHLWEMKVKEEPDNLTRVVLEEMRFDEPLAEGMFTLTNLKRSEAVR